MMVRPVVLGLDGTRDGLMRLAGCTPSDFASATAAMLRDDCAW